VKPGMALHKQRRRGSRLPAGAVVVDRTSRRGNPFTVEQILTDSEAGSEVEARALAVRRYANWLDGHGPARLPIGKSRHVDRDWINAHMDELAGVDLACTCPLDGLPCHRDVLLARAAERALYRERAQLLALLAVTWPAVLRLSPYSPPPTVAVLYLNTPAGQLSWHIAEADLDLFDHVQRANSGTPDPWDGHTTATKYDRVSDLVDQLTQPIPKEQTR
jgi:hypothetical protein